MHFPSLPTYVTFSNNIGHICYQTSVVLNMWPAPINHRASLKYECLILIVHSLLLQTIEQVSSTSASFCLYTPCFYKPLNKSQVRVPHFACTIYSNWNQWPVKRWLQYFINLSGSVTSQHNRMHLTLRRTFWSRWLLVSLSITAVLLIPATGEMRYMSMRLVPNYATKGHIFGSYYHSK